MDERSTTRAPVAGATLEVLDRIDAARTICDAALLGGPWLNAQVLEGVSDLVHAAARWAEIVEVAS